MAPAELGGGTGDESVHIRARPHIADERDRAGARLCQLMDGIARSVRIDVRDGDGCAGRGERSRDRAPDAVASTSDDQAAHAVQWLSRVHGRIFSYRRRRLALLTFRLARVRREHQIPPVRGLARLPYVDGYGSLFEHWVVAVGLLV
jgi:hypothetical protein